ncbi:HEAT repeat domain-containing protein [Geitlerinema sp. PCC 7407]|uniref:HEAT repeat domain-containing protein n=1 Tax=Geitlerinema sp. PCC 7407 TaxID=1173025 RepID=UPI00029FC3B6|nr:HEAT repeat domain-containing protein [Geitlerinema sp. PCC 7407]AFY66071.1 HEAT domain containing protein [Geitlerinema sp. PCC 7407]
MYDDEDLSVLDADESLESPLDKLGPVDEETARPDPDLMLALLHSPDKSQRMLAARAFCELQDARAVSPLIGLLTDACPLVRVSAAYALGRNPDASAVDPLIDQLKRDWNGYVRKGVVWALGNCRDRRSLHPLLNALKTDIAAVRLWAASSLGQMAEVDYETAVGAVPALIQALLKDPMPVVRSNCAWSLGQICRELPSNAIYAGAIDGLIEALVEDEDVGVQEDAKASLLKVGDARALQIIEELEQEGFL